MVRPAGIEPATLSLGVRSSHTRHHNFTTLSVQDTAPARYLFTLADSNASLTGGHRETHHQNLVFFAQSSADP